MVVAIHCMGRSLSGAELSLFDIAARNLMNVAVPIFLGISGFFVAEKTLMREGAFQSFLQKQIPRVYVPMLFCGLPILASELFHGKTLWKHLVLYFGGGYSVYYFVLLILQCYVLSRLFERIYAAGKFRRLLAFAAMLSPVCWAAYIYGAGKALNLSLPLFVYAGGIWMWGIFFLTGFWIGKRKFRAYPLKLWIICAVGGAFCAWLKVCF